VKLDYITNSNDTSSGLYCNTAWSLQLYTWNERWLRSYEILIEWRDWRPRGSSQIFVRSSKVGLSTADLIILVIVYRMIGDVIGTGS